MLNRLIRFALVGGTGFVADSIAMYLLYISMGWPLVQARVAAFIFAATITWFGNRTFTFNSQNTTPLSQWWKSMTSSVLSFCPNLLVFMLISDLLGHSKPGVAIAIMFGIGVGMLSNFCLSHYWVFRPVTRP